MPARDLRDKRAQRVADLPMVGHDGMGAAAELFLQRAKNIAVAELLHRLPDIRNRGGFIMPTVQTIAAFGYRPRRLFQKFPVFTGKDSSPAAPCTI